MEAHLGADAVERFGQEMLVPHPRFQGAERVFGGLSAHPHGLRRLVQPFLHGLEDCLMFPTAHPTVIARRTFGLDWALRAMGTPITA